MITGQCIQRLAFAAALLVLPLIIYCSEIAGNPYPVAGSAGQGETVAPSSAPSVPPATGRSSVQDKSPGRRILADMKNRTHPDS